MKSIVISISILTGIYTGTALAESAQDAYRLGHYVLAGQQLQPLDPVNEYYLGKLRLYGYGLLKNTPLALHYFTEAAQKGYLPAELLLARYSLIVKNNPSEALVWFKKAAAIGDNDARMYCAAAYLFGYGTAKNPDMARKYYIDAAKSGVPLAQYTLGKYFLGSRDKQSKQLGLIWLSKAAKLGSAQAQQTLEKLEKNPAHSKEEVVSEDLPSGPIQLQTIISWLTEGKTAEVSQSPYALKGIFLNWANKNTTFENHYNQPPLMPQVTKETLFKPKFKMIKPNDIAISDYFENIAHFNKVAPPVLQDYPQYPLYPTFELLRYHDSLVLQHEDENVFIYPETLLDSADTELHVLTLLEIVPKDQNRRLNYQKALLDLYGRAILGESSAQFELGQLYQAGVAVAKNPKAAINYYELAAIQQETRAEYNLGLLYLSGQTDPIDYEKGLDWLLDAAFKGNAYAQYALGSIYQYGLMDEKNEVLLEPNIEQAMAMYHLASANDFAPAEYQLANMLTQTNQADLNVRMKAHRSRFIKQLYHDAANKGIRDAFLPLAFYQAMSHQPDEQLSAFETAALEAQSGNTTASLLLGLLYDRGIGIAVNHTEAIRWYKEANVHPVSAFILGTYASRGIEEGGDKKKAKELLTFASGKKLPFADYNLAILNYQQQEPFVPSLLKAREAGSQTAGLLLADYYLNKATSQEELKEAYQLYAEFAKKGDAEAATKLAYLYDHGIGTLPNPFEAEKWYRVAATQNYPMGQYLLGELYQAGRLNGQNHVNEAKHWYEEAAKNGNVNAPIALGFIQETHDEDYQAANLAYQKASTHQNPVAFFNLGLIKEYGKGEPVDYQQAFIFYQKSAELGSDAGMVQLGKLYLKGLGTEKDTALAETWFTKAAEQKNRQALYQLGLMRFHGINQAADLQKAAAYFEEAANLGHEKALMHFAFMLESGKGISKDEARAIELYTQAARNHNARAAIELAKIYMQKGETRQAQIWLDQAKSAGHPEAEKLTSLLKNKAQF